MKKIVLKSYNPQKKLNWSLLVVHLHDGHIADAGVHAEGQLPDVEAVPDHEGDVLLVAAAAYLQDLQVQHRCQDIPGLDWIGLIG